MPDKTLMRLKRSKWIWVSLPVLLLIVVSYLAWLPFVVADPKILAQLIAAECKAQQTVPEGAISEQPPKPGEPCYELSLFQYTELYNVHTQEEYRRFINRRRDEFMATSPTVLFWAVALLLSTLYGWKAVEIFTTVRPSKTQPAKAWWWHQRWLNFLGSLVGWTALWVLGRRYSSCIFEPCSTRPTGLDGVAAIVAFIGVTGHLPYTIVGAVAWLPALGLKAAELIERLVPKAPKGDS